MNQRFVFPTVRINSRIMWMLTIDTAVIDMVEAEKRRIGHDEKQETINLGRAGSIDVQPGRSDLVQRLKRRVR